MLHVITIVLVLLKAFHVIDWNWWLCFAPSLVELAIYAAIWLFAIGCGLIAGLVNR